MKDLIVLVADKNMEYLIRGLFPRLPLVEGVREFTFEIVVHPERDPGIYTDADDFLRPFINQYSYAMVIFDHHGCGHEQRPREEVGQMVMRGLENVGWQDRSCVVCISPELENWIWVNETRMQEAISWNNRVGLYEWLHQNNWKNPNQPKPKRPKEAFESAIRECRTPRSSSLYHRIASRASYKSCQDPAFHNMLEHIRRWFSNEP